MWNRKLVTTGCALAVAAVVAACSETAPTEPVAATPEQASLFGTPADPQTHRTRDDALLEVTRAVPGYGGHFYDADGVLNVHMVGVVPQSTQSSLRSRLAAVGAEVGPETRMRSAAFTFDQLHGWRKRADAAMSLAGVVFTDVDDAANRITIGVENEAAARSVRTALAMAGVPAGAVIIREAEPIRLMQTLQQRVRPVAGGLQINFPGFVCTLGFNVRSPQNPAALGFVTNSHCTNVQGQQGTTPYWQPVGSVAGPSDPNWIGTEAHDVPFFTNAQNSNCPVGRQCRWSDAAGVRYGTGVQTAFARIYRTTGPNNGSLTIDAANPTFTIVAERAFPDPGDTMHKVGRTTGWTSGSVSQSCANVNVTGTNITLLCQEIVTGASGIVQGGDSGSAVFEPFPAGQLNTVRLVGLLWGGGSNTFVFSAMSEVRFENPPPAGFTWTVF
jgi:hypothetical protein